jgi:uncharacterized protein (TIGR03435 family)
MTVIRPLGILVLAAAGVYAQPAKPRLEFEVASIKPCPPYDAMSGAKVSVGMRVDGAQVHYSFLSLKDLIRQGYKLKLHQILGPDWIASERWNIDATLPAGATTKDVPEMLQSLIEERFQMKYHHESKEFPVYGLVQVKGGAKLKESPPDETPAGEPSKAAVDMQATGGPQGTSVNLGNGSTYFFGDNKLEAKKLQMVQFAEILGRFVERPVVDMTELPGKYDFLLKFSDDDYRTMLIRSAIAAGINLPPEALKMIEGTTDDPLMAPLATVGLKLEKRKAPLDVMVIDSVSRTPAQN